LNIGREFIGVAFYFLFDERVPVRRIHFLVGHERQLLWRNFEMEDLIQQIVRQFFARIFAESLRRFAQIDCDCSQTVNVQLYEIRILPFFYDFLACSFFDSIIEDAPL
jgi:hypothetical protein